MALMESDRFGKGSGSLVFWAQPFCCRGSAEMRRPASGNRGRACQMPQPHWILALRGRKIMLAAMRSEDNRAEVDLPADDAAAQLNERFD